MAGSYILTEVTLPLEAFRQKYEFPKNEHLQDFWGWLIPAQHLVPEESYPGAAARGREGREAAVIPSTP